MTILFVEIDGCWKQMYSTYASDGYGLCLQYTETLDEHISWMIVKVMRQHSGTEKFEL